MKIGYIGLGALGSQLARSLLRTQPVLGWDLFPAAREAFRGLGGEIAESAADLAARCDVVLLCLPRSSDVRECLFGSGGVAAQLAAGSLVIDQTSGMPGETREMAERLAARGVAMIDAAVSGSPQLAGEGKATLMAAGPAEAVALAMPVLQAISPAVFVCGTRVGDGQAMKSLNNAMNAGNRIGTLEVVALGRKAGLALPTMVEVLNAGGARNQITDRMLPAIAEGRPATNFALALQIKDHNQAMELGMSLGVPMPAAGAVRALLQIGLNTLGDAARLEDMVKVVESLYRVRFRDDDKTAAPAWPEAPADAAGARLGYVGLGTMGGAIARRLLKSRPLTVFDIRPDVTQSFAGRGAAIATDLPALARASDVILLCLPTSSQVQAAIFGPDGLAQGLAAGKIIVDQTSGDPTESRHMAAELARIGVEFLDAPVSGGARGAEAGTLAVMVGGAPTAAARVRPAFEAISNSVFYCGGVGNGHVTKIVNNAISSLARVLSYECLAVGFKYGLTLKAMSEVFNKASGWSSSLQKMLQAIEAGRTLSMFQFDLMIKDLRLAARLGAQVGAPLVIPSLVRGQFEAAGNELGGSASIEELTRIYERTAAVRFGAA